MSAKSSGSRFSYAKALIFFVALLACLGSSVAAAESSSVIRNAHGLDKLNAASSSVSSIKRHLRSSADTGAGGYSISRRLSLTQSLSKVVSELQKWWWWLWRKSLGDKYKDLKLHLAYRYKDAADLAKILVEGKNIESTKFVASKLLDFQVRRWDKKDKSAEQVFRLLKLDMTEGGPFKSQIFMQWVAFVQFKYRNFPDDATDVMLLTLAGQYKTDAALARALVAEKKIESTRSIASKLLNAQAWRWKDDDKSEAHVFRLLELHETGDKLFGNPLFMQWVAFVNLRFRYPDEAIEAMSNTLRVYYTNDEELTEVLAAGTKIPATKEIALKLQKIQPPKQNDWVETFDFPSFGFVPSDRY